MLLTLSNLAHLRAEIIPQLISQFETNFSIKLTDESKTIRDVLGQIDARLFQSYVQPTVEQVKQYIRWYRESRLGADNNTTNRCTTIRLRCALKTSARPQ